MSETNKKRWRRPNLSALSYSDLDILRGFAQEYAEFYEGSDKTQDYFTNVRDRIDDVLMQRVENIFGEVPYEDEDDSDESQTEMQ